MVSTYIFHITDIKNLHGIVDGGGLLAKSEIDRRGAIYENIAYDGLQDRRSTTVVPCGPGGVLHNYVPFYFAPRSPMLLAIQSGGVEGYSGTQSSIIYLVTTVQAIAAEPLEFVFTDGHGIMTITDFFQDLTDLDKIDWAIMKENYWANTEEDGDRKRRRQAEFLISKFCPWHLIKKIGVHGVSAEQSVKELIAVLGHKPEVKVERSWYYP
ncbi:MAG: DUF4433 domain-containing protein [Cyanobacteria bacterium SZAS TMP-1]|nr:DUF4433 domain-containing protein [Cyanobacteria bacterium SZAS TMP-1]